MAFCNWLREMPDNFLRASQGGSSILITINHMSKAQLFWTKFLNGEDLNSFSWSVNIDSSAKEIELFDSTSRALQEKCLSFTNEELLTPVEFKASWAENTLERMHYILHCVNHNTHHRGQIVSIARANGYQQKIPATEYAMFMGELARN